VEKSNSSEKKNFSLTNRLFLTLDSVKKSLFFTLELLFFTLEKKLDLDIPRWRGA
jgi:hypothetical protein